MDISRKWWKITMKAIALTTMFREAMVERKGKKKKKRTNIQCHISQTYHKLVNLTYNDGSKPQSEAVANNHRIFFILTTRTLIHCLMHKKSVQSLPKSITTKRSIISMMKLLHSLEEISTPKASS